MAKVKIGKIGKKAKRANSTTRAAGKTKTARGPYKKKDADAPKAKRKKHVRRGAAVSVNLPELFQSGLDQVNAQIKERTEQLILAATEGVEVGTSTVSTMLTEAAKNAEADSVIKNLLTVRTSLQSSLFLVQNLEDKPGRKAKEEVSFEAEWNDEEVVEGSEGEEFEDKPKRKEKVKSKVVSIDKKKGKASKAAATLKKKKPAEAAEG